MTGSPIVMSVGAVCFGLVVGYITYRTLARSSSTGVSDLAAVLAAVGGGTVMGLYDPAESDLFGWYAIGLLGGMVAYGVIFRLTRGAEEFGKVMGDDGHR